jgi:signal transduction histidine kinase
MRLKHLSACFWAGLCLGCVVVRPLQAQQLNEDSIRQVITNAGNDTARVTALLTLSNYQIKHKMQDSVGLLTLEEAIGLAGRIHYRQGVAQGLMIKGSYYNSKHLLAQSLDAYDQMMQVAQDINNDSVRNRLLMMAYNNVGGIYNDNGDFRNSLMYRLKALAIVEKYTPSNHTNLGIIYLNIASDYRQLKMPGKALEYLDKTTSFFPKLNERLKMEYYYEYYHNYLEYGKAVVAKAMLGTIEEGLRTFNLSDFQKKDYSLMLAKLSGIYELEYERNYARALEHYQRYEALARELKLKTEITESLYRIGEAQLASGNIPAAIASLQQSYNMAAANGFKNQLMKAELLLADAHKKSGNAAEANKLLEKAMAQRAEIYNDNTVKELAFAEAQYQSEKKKNEIAALTLSNTEKELKIVKRDRLLLQGELLLVALLLAGGYFYSRNNRKRREAERAEKEKQEQILFLERQQQVVSLQSMINGQETERTRIAKDLHDGLGGLFSTIKMHFSTLQHEVQELRNYPLFTRSYELVNDASDEVRRIAHNMMPEVLIRIGLVPAVRELCNGINAGKLLQVRLQDYGMEERLQAATEIMLYRILQELLNNIMKHAHATEAVIQFNREADRLSITVEDNGRGFNVEADKGTGSAGLESVKSRVNYLNGTLFIDSQQEIGTTVMMVFLINH